MNDPAVSISSISQVLSVWGIVGGRSLLSQ